LKENRNSNYSSTRDYGFQFLKEKEIQFLIRTFQSAQLVLIIRPGDELLEFINNKLFKTLDREFVLEFSDYFNESYKPVEEFGKKFFEPFWNSEEWNSFDNFMIECLQYYLKNGLKDYERINLNNKMLIEMTSEEFVEFMESLTQALSKGEGFSEKFDKKELHKKFIEEYPDFNNLHQKTFTNWLM
jgi:hypothetical protein